MKGNFEKIKLSTLLKIAVGIGIAAILVSVFISNHKNSYAEMIHDWRQQRDEYFKSDPSSPIEDKENFSGLNYFDPDLEYKVEAHVTLLNDTSTFTMNRTDGKKEIYKRYAIASFQMHKKEYQLILFTDRTTGELTYNTGRYLDLEQKEPDKVIIDFNYAYNPFCSYSPRYSCPIPPKENDIDIEILAGEKIFEKKKNTETDN
jgi:hypothetical protein